MTGTTASAALGKQLIKVEGARFAGLEFVALKNFV